jgi:hypothetical protein
MRLTKPVERVVERDAGEVKRQKDLIIDLFNDIRVQKRQTARRVL